MTAGNQHICNGMREATDSLCCFPHVVSVLSASGVDVGVSGVFLYEFTAGLHFLAHEH